MSLVHEPLAREEESLDVEVVIRQVNIEIVDEYEKQGKRPPAEDIRTARAKRHVREHDPELFVTYMQLLTRQKALRMTISSEKEVISGKQSVLNGLRAAGA